MYQKGDWTYEDADGLMHEDGYRITPAPKKAPPIADDDTRRAFQNWQTGMRATHDVTEWGTWNFERPHFLTATEMFAPHITLSHYGGRTIDVGKSTERDVYRALVGEVWRYWFPKETEKPQSRKTL